MPDYLKALKKSKDENSDELSPSREFLGKEYGQPKNNYMFGSYSSPKVQEPTTDLEKKFHKDTGNIFSFKWGSNSKEQFSYVIHMHGYEKIIKYYKENRNDVLKSSKRWPYFYSMLKNWDGKMSKQNRSGSYVADGGTLFCG